MKRIATLIAVAALALTGTVAHAGTAAERGEAKLARMLEGRTAGTPVNCISAMNSNRLEVIERVGLVYRSGETIYVARASDPRALGPWDIPVIKRYSSQLCTSDVIRTVDRSGGYTTGVVFLEDFVPYTRG